MVDMDFIDSIMSWMKRFIPQPDFVPTERMNTIKNLLRMIEQTSDEEYSCEEVFELLDLYTEKLVEGEDTKKMMPLVERHLAMCPDCREEFEGLLNILEISNAPGNGN